jgi:ABC-type Fe3+-hydroxamate transport system substrate-binding protein
MLQYKMLNPDVKVSQIVWSILAILICGLFLPLSLPAHAKQYPQRIVSLGPINTENVFLLGAGDRLVANTNYCVRPEAAKTKVKIGSVMQFSIEKIISLNPDLILATGLTRPEQVQQLQAAGIEVIHVPQPKSFAEICSQFLKLGKLLGLEKEAEQIVAQAQEKVSAIHSRSSTLPKQKVFLQVGSQPIFASVPSSFTNDFIVLSGGINITAQQKTGRSNYEQVIAGNPDVIIIAMMGSEAGAAAEEKQKWQKISVINAVKNERVFIIDPDIACSPSPSTFASTLELVAKLIHP